MTASSGARRARVEFEAGEAVVVGVLLDVLGRGVCFAAPGREVLQARPGVSAGLTRSVDTGERDHGPTDAHPCDAVVGLEIAPPVARVDDSADDAGLVHLPLEALRVADAVAGTARLVGFQARVDVDHAKSVLQLQHGPSDAVSLY